MEQVAADFCSYQSIALELIKTKQRKETRFQIFMQVCPSPGGHPDTPVAPPDPTSGLIPSSLRPRKRKATRSAAACSSRT